MIEKGFPYVSEDVFSMFQMTKEIKISRLEVFLLRSEVKIENYFKSVIFATVFHLLFYYNSYWKIPSNLRKKIHVLFVEN